MAETNDDQIAPEGFIWVCTACGKTAKDRYGLIGEHSAGWDASCMLNSELFKEDRLEIKDGRVIKVRAE